MLTVLLAGRSCESENYFFRKRSVEEVTKVGPHVVAATRFSFPATLFKIGRHNELKPVRHGITYTKSFSDISVIVAFLKLAATFAEFQKKESKRCARSLKRAVFNYLEEDSRVTAHNCTFGFSGCNWVFSETIIFVQQFFLETTVNKMHSSKNGAS